MNTAPYGWTKAGDAVDVRRSGFPVDIETEPGALEPWHLPHMGQRPNDAAAEIEAARMAGARMGGGLQEPSRPMPLAAHRRTPQHYWSRAADWAMLALAVGTAAGWLLAKVFA